MKPAPLRDTGFELVPYPSGAGAEVTVDPSTLSPMAEDAVAALLKEGESENTLRSYRTALRYWAAWYVLRFGRQISLPVAVPAVLQFIVDHAARKTKKGLVTELPPAIDAALVAGGFKHAPGIPALATLSHRISVLSKAHRLKALTNPCQSAEVRELLARTRVAYSKRGVRQVKKAALTLDPLEALLATCDDSLSGVRDRALLLFAWSSGGRRRSEVVAANVEDLEKAGRGKFKFNLRRSKTNQAGAARDDNVKPVVGPAAEALMTWLRRSGIKEGAIFRRVRRGDKVAERLSAAAVRRIVQQRCLDAGLEGDFSAHSLRSGFVTEAARQKIPMGETMAMTGHTSVATVIGYFRSESALDSGAATLYSPMGKR